MRNPFLIIRFIFFCESRSISCSILKLIVLPALMIYMTILTIVFASWNVGETISSGLPGASLFQRRWFNQINSGLFGSARGAGIFDFEWRRTLCIHRCVRLDYSD